MTTGLRVLLYDDTQGFLTRCWRIGSRLSRWDAIIAASSWQEAVQRIALLPDGIRELQFWGHGTDGQPLIAQRMLSSYITDLSVAGRFHKIPNSLIWWRACNVFGGARGRDFAIAAPRVTGCAHVGHTRVISWPWPFLQSGGYAIRPGEKVHWDPFEGITPDGKYLGSNPLAKNTCLVTTMTVPHSWWKD